MLKFFLIFPLLYISFAQDAEYHPFVESEYPLAKFYVSKGLKEFSNFQIEIIQVNPKEGNFKSVMYCRAWLNVKKNGQEFKEFYFKNIEAVGDYYGIYLQNEQTGFLPIILRDGYSAVIYLFGENGSFNQLIGSSYYIHNGLIFTELSSDLFGVNVLNLKTNKMIFENIDDLPRAENWYLFNEKILYRPEDAENQNIYIEFKDSKFQKVLLSNTEQNHLIKIEFHFDKSILGDCICKNGNIKSTVVENTDYKTSFNVKTIRVSSELKPQNNIAYNGQNLIDKNKNTAWVEGNSSFGIGEFLEVEIDLTNSLDHYLLQEIYITNGYAKSMDHWKFNTRVKSLQMSVNDNPEVILNLEDTIKTQKFEFEFLKLLRGAKYNIKFTITDVFRGKRYKDAAISELFIKTKRM